eukprot:9839217-Prorocentrum_lima.AAC.1
MTSSLVGSEMCIRDRPHSLRLMPSLLVRASLASAPSAFLGCDAPLALGAPFLVLLPRRLPAPLSL